MSCDAWKWITASAYDEIWPEDDCFVSWQRLRLQYLTLFHLQNKVCHLGSLYQPEQGPEHDVKPHNMFWLEKVQTPVLQLLQRSTHLILGLHSSHICILEVQSIHYVKQNFVYTLDNWDYLLLLANSQEMLMRTCRLSASPGCDLEIVLPLGALCVWGDSFGLASSEKAFELSAAADTCLSPLPPNLVYLLLLFPEAFALVSYAKPNLKVIVFIFPGLTPQILFSSSSSSACIISEEFLFPILLLSFFKT